MKKVLSLCFAAAIALSMTACSPSKPDCCNDKNDQKTTKESTSKK